MVVTLLKNHLIADSEGLIKVDHYKIECVFIVEQYFKNNESLVVTVLKFCTNYGQNCDLTYSAAKRTIKKFRQIV